MKHGYNCIFAHWKPHMDHVYVNRIGRERERYNYPGASLYLVWMVTAVDYLTWNNRSQILCCNSIFMLSNVSNITASDAYSHKTCDVNGMALSSKGPHWHNEGMLFWYIKSRYTKHWQPLTLIKFTSLIIYTWPHAIVMYGNFNVAACLEPVKESMLLACPHWCWNTEFIINRRTLF